MYKNKKMGFWYKNKRGQHIIRLLHFYTTSKFLIYLNETGYNKTINGHLENIIIVDRFWCLVINIFLYLIIEQLQCYYSLAHTIIIIAIETL